MSSSRLQLLCGLVLVAFSSACSSSNDSSESGGTTPDDGKFVPPPTKPEDGQKSSSTGSNNTAEKKTGSTSTSDAGAAGTCGTPQCGGIAGFCACDSSNAGKQTVMTCNGGKCQCNGKTFADNGACGTTANAPALKTLFASCGCM